MKAVADSSNNQLNKSSYFAQFLVVLAFSSLTHFLVILLLYKELYEKLCVHFSKRNVCMFLQATFPSVFLCVLFSAGFKGVDRGCFG